MDNFNGYNVYFHDLRNGQNRKEAIETIDYSSILSSSPHEIPSIEDLIDGLYEVYGDVVFMVKDNDGNVLVDKTNEDYRHYNDSLDLTPNELFKLINDLDKLY